MRWLLPSILIMSACSSDRTPAWAFDPIWVEPTEGGIHALQTWEIFSERWHERRKEKFYLCSVVVELWGTPTTCESCLHAWSVEAEFLESDCDPSLAGDPTFTSLLGIGIGETTTSPEAPHPGSTSVGYADYGFGAWEEHGWAYPDALDAGRTPSSNEWDGEQPFLLWPTLDWPLQ